MDIKKNTWYKNINHEDNPVAYLYITGVEEKRFNTLTVDLTPGSGSELEHRPGRSRLWLNDVWPERQTIRFEKVDKEEMSFVKYTLFESLFAGRFRK